MKKLIMTTAALALFASGPAFASCGSHGGSQARSYSAPSYAKPKYSAAPRAVAARVAPAAKAVKVASAPSANNQVDGGGSSNETVETKTQAAAPAPQAVAVKTTESAAAAPVLTAPQAEQTQCKKYSATIGGMITVPCE